MQLRVILLVLSVAIILPLPTLHADDAGIEFFEKKIRPVLAEHCYQCHSAKSKKVKGGLLLDHRDGLRKGGVSGTAIDPGHPDRSLLIKALRHVDPELKMPPEKKLPARVIADFEAWVKMGAPDPRVKAASVKTALSWEETVRLRGKWWSLQPVRNPAVPMPKNAGWSEQAIDRFLLTKLEEKGLDPARPADPHTLIRRLSLVLTGLPPTPDETARFVRDCGAPVPGQPLPAALVAKLVDSLLASPHFGERWARHWMDVVHFSETHGNEWNYEVHHAWRYRNYLIRAFNDDVPYDQLVREHIAGDLLPTPRWHPKEKFNESVIGTAFYRFGEVNHDDCISLRQIGYNLADNQIDTMTKAFQAMTVACARCHNHKLDAISMRDYYGLLGVVRSSRQVSHTINAPEVNADIIAKMHSKKKDIRREWGEASLLEVKQFARYLEAAAGKRLGNKVPPKDVNPALLEKWLTALADDKSPLENPLTIWRLLLAAQQKDKASFAGAWKKIAEQIRREGDERGKFNEKNFTTLADFHTLSWADWQIDGQGLRGNPSRHGDFAVAPTGEPALTAIYPAGFYTHVLSDKLNGALRSSILTTPKKRISFQVLGQRSAAVRLVSNNCQLNYTNFRALTSPEPKWITFSVPAPGENLRVYAELMTMFDNPKFPDQLGTLGGDKMDYRVPWEQAAANPRSFFGVSRVVLHDEAVTPKPELGHLRSLFSGPPPAGIAELAARYAQRLEAALRAWQKDQATEDDVRWLDAFLKRGLLNNRAKQTPRLAELIAEYRRLDGELALPRIAPGVADWGDGFKQPIFARGDCFKPGEPADRRFVEVLSPTTFRAGSGRWQLANTIATRDNPLTARVMVNRIWHHLFGAGLVRTADDFGHVGDLPSHPELLDHLAQRFVAEGWSIKRLIRAIVLTRTFQMAHQPSQTALEADPNNRLLQHFPARRMEAEAIRDSLLAASGRLDHKLYGMSIPAYREQDNTYRRLFRGPLDGNGRRSIYIKSTLMEAPKFLEAFDLPGGKVTQGRRDVTNVPAQALAMLNDPFVLGQADFWSKRLLADKNGSLDSRIDAMFRTALGRAPTAAESARLAKFVFEVAQLRNIPRQEVLGNEVVWRDLAHTIFNLREFITIP